MEEPAAGSEFRSGFVSVLGLPNVGKSSLVNQFLGKSVCITSFKAQTSRYHIRCIATSPKRQIVFVDTPGWVKTDRLIDKLFRREIDRGAEGVDVLLVVVDATRPQREANQAFWKAMVERSAAHRVVVLNKIDRLRKVELIPILEDLQKTFQPEELVPVSATRPTNLQELDRVVTAMLPPGPRFYPEDAGIDRPLEFVLSEFVREQLYTATRQELPFATAVHVEELQQGEELRLVASIFVEKPSQKGIVIGAGAAVIKAIRERATRRIEKFVGHSQVKVELTVKVKRNWRSDPAVLRSLWYE